MEALKGEEAMQFFKGRTCGYGGRMLPSSRLSLPSTPSTLRRGGLLLCCSPAVPDVSALAFPSRTGEEAA